MLPRFGGSGTLGDLLGWVPSPEEILGCVYAMLYHPAYGARYRSHLWHEFPRIPTPASADLFRMQSELGRRLVRLHLLENVAAPASLRLEGDLAATLAGRCSFDGRRLRLNARLTVEGVDPEVWSYRVGSYHVLARWLRARAGRTIMPPDLEDFGRIVEALRRTVELQKEIDRSGD